MDLDRRTERSENHDLASLVQVICVITLYCKAHTCRSTRVFITAFSSGFPFTSHPMIPRAICSKPCAANQP